jgi:uncharacterized protein YigA (DUF484 family)
MINTKHEIVDANTACARTFSWPAGMFAPMEIHRVITDVVDPVAAHARSVAEVLERENRDGVLVIAKSLDGRRFRAQMHTATVHGSRKISQVVYLREAPVEPADFPPPRLAAN